MNAYFDRLTPNHEAILLVEETNETVRISKEALPSNCSPGDWLRIQLDGQRVTMIEKNTSKTKAMQTTVEEKLAKLRHKKKSKYKRL